MPPESAPERTVGVYVGRFQPFHLGHAQMLADCVASFRRLDAFYVVIGSADHQREPANPWTFAERARFVAAAVAGLPRVGKIEVVPLADCGDDGIWADDCLAAVGHTLPSEQARVEVFTNNPRVAAAFRNAAFAHFPGPRVTAPGLYDAATLNGTAIRLAIQRGLGWDWRGAVSPAVAALIEETLAEESVRRVFWPAGEVPAQQ